MPTHWLAQVRLQRVNLNPEDIIVNTFHFDSGASTDSELVQANNIVSRLQTFYTALATVMSGLLAGTGHEVRVYRQEDPKPRVPLVTTTLNLSPTGNSYPAEICACLSFAGNPVSGEKAGRLRGRVYIGPLDISIAGDSAGDNRIPLSLRSTLTNAAKVLADSAGPLWSVYSEANQLEPGGDEGWTEIVRMWVDDAWDIQRRRGARASTRTQTLKGP